MGYLTKPYHAGYLGRGATGGGGSLATREIGRWHNNNPQTSAVGDIVVLRHSASSTRDEDDIEFYNRGANGIANKSAAPQNEQRELQVPLGIALEETAVNEFGDMLLRGYAELNLNEGRGTDISWGRSTVGDSVYIERNSDSGNTYYVYSNVETPYSFRVGEYVGLSDHANLHWVYFDFEGDTRVRKVEEASSSEVTSRANVKKYVNPSHLPVSTTIQVRSPLWATFDFAAEDEEDIPTARNITAAGLSAGLRTLTGLNHIETHNIPAQTIGLWFELWTRGATPARYGQGLMTWGAGETINLVTQNAENDDNVVEIVWQKGGAASGNTNDRLRIQKQGEDDDFPACQLRVYGLGVYGDALDVGNRHSSTKSNTYAAVKEIFHPATNDGISADDSNNELDLSVGTVVVANPTGTPTERLLKITIAGTEYNVGLQLSANPSGSDGSTLTRINIGGTNYNISAGTVVAANPAGSSGTTLTRIAIAGQNYNLAAAGGGGDIDVDDWELRNPAETYLGTITTTIDDNATAVGTMLMNPGDTLIIYYGGGTNSDIDTTLASTTGVKVGGIIRWRKDLGNNNYLDVEGKITEAPALRQGGAATEYTYQNIEFTNHSEGWTVDDATDVHVWYVEPTDIGEILAAGTNITLTENNDGTVTIMSSVGSATVTAAAIYTALSDSTLPSYDAAAIPLGAIEFPAWDGDGSNRPGGSAGMIRIGLSNMVAYLRTQITGGSADGRTYVSTTAPTAPSGGFNANDVWIDPNESTAISYGLPGVDDGETGVITLNRRSSDNSRWQQFQHVATRLGSGTAVPSGTSYSQFDYFWSRDATSPGLYHRTAVGSWTRIFTPGSGGGTTVTANPAGAGTTALTKVTIGSTIYTIAASGTDGADGDSIRIIFRAGTSAPSAPTDGSGTYDQSAGTYTAPTNWGTTVPSVPAGSRLYGCIAFLPGDSDNDTYSGVFVMQGADGTNGNDGNRGWSPILNVVSDTDRRVFQVNDWTGGQGTKPATGSYVGATGLVSNISNAVDIRGPAGSGGGGGTTVVANPTGTFTNVIRSIDIGGTKYNIEGVNAHDEEGLIHNGTTRSLPTGELIVEGGSLPTDVSEPIGLDGDNSGRTSSAMRNLNKPLGISLETIAAGEVGRVQVTGVIQKALTSGVSWTRGDSVYAKQATPTGNAHTYYNYTNTVVDNCFFVGKVIKAEAGENPYVHWDFTGNNFIPHADVGTTVAANPSGTSGSDMTRISLDGTPYNIGTSVAANPSAAGTTTLTKIQIGSVVYNLPTSSSPPPPPPASPPPPPPPPPPAATYTVAYGLSSANGTKVTPPNEATVTGTTGTVDITTPALTSTGVTAYFELPQGRTLSNVFNVGIGRTDETSLWTQVTGTNRYYSEQGVTGGIYHIQVVST